MIYCFPDSTVDQPVDLEYQFEITDDLLPSSPTDKEEPLQRHKLAKLADLMS
jgi:hypothetical protein